MSEHHPQGETTDDATGAAPPDEPADEGWPGERKRDEDGQTLAENEQQQPRTITQKLENLVEDLIPGDSDKDGH